MTGIKPRLLIIAGPDGSGKTTITSQVLKHEWMQGCAHVNADFIDYNKLGDWNSPETVQEAAQIATERRERCLEERES